MSFNSVNPITDALSMSGDELERNRRLVGAIRRAIEQSENKAISFAEFMGLALYHPKYGYYTSANQVLGREGDFTTAPELGAVFGRILAVKIASLFESNRAAPRIYEFGAGNGSLAFQILSELSLLDCRVEEYVIIEVSPRLKQIQQQSVSQLAPEQLSKVVWLDAFQAESMQGVVIANEVLDAMPVELMRCENGEVLQGYIVESGNGFQIEFRDTLDKEIESTIDRLDLPELENGYTSELHCRAEAWMRQIAECLKAGAVLIADYGFPQHEYYHPDRREGTLMCHRRHHSLHDPFAYIGCQDITAHLNFSALAQVAQSSGLEVNGFTTLAGFIVDIGIGRLDFNDCQGTERLSVAQQLNTLTSPAEMGELFKMMELTKNIESDRLGFESLDQLHRL